MEKSSIAIEEGVLKVETISEGGGPKPRLGDTILMHYVLYLGTGVASAKYDYDKHCYVDDLVDSTYDGPFAGPVKIVIGKETVRDSLYKEGDSIEGLDKALLEMTVGSKSRVFVPSELAYGRLGGSSFYTFHGYRTPPNRSLDMVVELLEIIDNE